MKKTEDLLWDFIRDNEIATEEELSLVTSINGYNEESMMNVIFARTGLRTIDQCYDEGVYYLSDELKERYGLDESEDEDDED